jgi:hypothetical protein
MLSSYFKNLKILKVSISRFLNLLSFECVLECRELFLQEIMDWTDYYSENCSSEPSGEESGKVLDSLTKLWINYAEFESSLKQFKNAVEVFDSALQDPIVGKTSRIFIAYADYCMTRNKPGNAQKVLIRGLSTSGLEKEHTDLIWKTLLTLTNKVTNSQSTLQQLYNAVLPQIGLGTQLAPLPAEIPPIKEEPSAKKDETRKSSVDFAEIKVEVPSSEANAAAAAPSISSSSSSDSQLPVEPGSEFSPVDSPLPVVDDDFDNLTGMTPEQIVHLYRVRPLMLFVAPNQVSIVFLTFLLFLFVDLSRSRWRQV